MSFRKKILIYCINWLYKWLPIITNCHRRSDRSFFYKGNQFPVCARCTGVLAGTLASCLTIWFLRPPVCFLLICMLPMAADGLIQMFTSYESRNRRRFLTGFLFGWAVVCIFWEFEFYLFECGAKAGAILFMKHQWLTAPIRENTV